MEKQVVPVDFSQDQIELIKNTVAKGASNDELSLFLHQCKKTGLDPLSKQIYFQKRGGKMTILTGIDGYRLIAHRSGLYAGADPTIFDNEEDPKKATVTVYKIVAGVRCPFSATARWEQYFPGDAQGFMWRKMPHLMLEKCAEALALRKAFPAELSGVYTDAEMEQADRPIVTVSSPIPSLQERLSGTSPEEVKDEWFEEEEEVNFDEYTFDLGNAIAVMGYKGKKLKDIPITWIEEQVKFWSERNAKSPLDPKSKPAVFLKYAEPYIEHFHKTHTE